MTLRLGPLASCAAVLGALAFATDDARACGGCFHVESMTESTVVTGHRMAFAISTTHTVLWDQIKYAGDPSDFAWVLPIKEGAYVELSNDAWFEALDATTQAQVVSPAMDCGGSGGPSGCGFGCSAMGAADAFNGSGGDAPPPVTVVHQGAVGPYETVTLHANVPDALPTWLTSHGYAIDASVQPLIDAYVSEGFDFIALRLLPDKGVQQMKPVRVVTPGMAPSLPLRMVAAGTGANVDITLFVIGEGRWRAQNFPNGVIDPKGLVWDFQTSSSNYSELRLALLAKEQGRTWNNAYAKQGALLSQLENPIDGSIVQYTVGSLQRTTIAEAYLQQGIQNGETQTQSCSSAFEQYATSNAQVVNPCPAGNGSGGGGTGGAGTGGAGTGGAGTGGAGTGGAGGIGGQGGQSCGEVGVGEIDARELACGTLDDVAVALEGLHPADVWVTRLEAHLPRTALADDLALEATTDQTTIENWLSATNTKNAPCALNEISATTPADRASHRRRNAAALLGAIAAALAATLGRRAQRRAPAARRLAASPR